eukprot:3479470-Pleurochrysis_carterae.AAC.2
MASRSRHLCARTVAGDDDDQRSLVMMMIREVQMRLAMLKHHMHSVSCHAKNASSSICKEAANTVPPQILQWFK